MAATRAHCKAQIEKLAVFFPVSECDAPDVLRIAVDTLCAVAVSDEHATQTVDEILNDPATRRFPTPGIIRQVAAQLADRTNPSAGCPVCDGTGFEIRWYLVTYERTRGGGSHRTSQRITAEQARELERKVDWRTQYVYSGACRCTACDYGRRMAEAELVEQAKSEGQ